MSNTSSSWTRLVVTSASDLMPMKPLVLIRSIPHQDQRYDTVGDYYEMEGLGGKFLSISVSQLEDRREVMLIAIHELIEWALCQAKGITNEEIDKFDFAFKDYLGREPGDDPRAPYFHQHQVASVVERLLAAELGVDWEEYSKHCGELSK